jgi:hypothetical protein
LDQDDDYPDEFRASNFGDNKWEDEFRCVRSITSEIDKKNTAFAQLGVSVNVRRCWREVEVFCVYLDAYQMFI